MHPFLKKKYKKIKFSTFQRLNKFKKMGYTVKYIWENDWKKFKKGEYIYPNIITL